jgi:polysaccharide biosynthesis/export protein
VLKGLTRRGTLFARHAALSVVLSLSLNGCAIRNLGPQLKDGPAEPERFPIASENLTLADYRIGPFDTLRINVFQEPDLSVDEVQVDAAGRINLALVGEVTATGKTALELSRELERAYGESYLVRPQIAVSVASSISQKVTVQGEVRTPGVYPIKGATTLLEAISLAAGETEVSSLRQVVILRSIGGQKMGALFDVESIRRGEAQDPAIFGNDIVIVGFSNARGLWRDTLRTVPLLNVFQPFNW